VTIRTVFSGGEVFDGSGAPPARADVVVEDGRIVDVGIGLDGDEQVDVTGRTLLPGMFDCHVHLIIDHIDIWRHLQTPFSYKYFVAAKNLAAILGVGITTVRDAAGADLGIKEAAATGIIPSPRVQIAISMLSQTGGHADSWMASGVCLHAIDEVPGSPSGVVDGPEEMRKRVRELIRAGADVIKVASSGGVMSPRDNPRHAHFRAEELEMAVSEAAAAGLGVMAHAQATEGIKNAVRAGVRSIEHGIFLDDEAIEMMLERGTYLVPTLMAPHSVIDAAGEGASITDASLAKARSVIEAHAESFRKAAAAGVKIAMGTDAVGYPHGRNLEELELMAANGLAPVDVLRSATSVAADLLGVSEDLGTIAPGKRADVVVLQGDPFDFAKMRSRVERVYKDGKLVATGGDPAVLPPAD
jgi:imidazolonepropionase-like amidohydrolase